MSLATLCNINHHLNAVSPHNRLFVATVRKSPMFCAQLFLNSNPDVRFPSFHALGCCPIFTQLSMLSRCFFPSPAISFVSLDLPERESSSPLSAGSPHLRWSGSLLCSLHSAFWSQLSYWGRNGILLHKRRLFYMSTHRNVLTCVNWIWKTDKINKIIVNSS